jgi:hypothetical protein
VTYEVTFYLQSIVKSTTLAETRLGNALVCCFSKKEKNEEKPLENAID